MRHDEEIAETAKLRVRVRIHESVLRNLKSDEGGWLTLPGGEKVSVFFEITPDGWRGLANALLMHPEEPEWRMVNARMPNGKAMSPWVECMPDGNGPGVWLTSDSSVFSLMLVEPERPFDKK